VHKYDFMQSKKICIVFVVVVVVVVVIDVVLNNGFIFSFRKI
jgi:type III secretory pathway component EscU